MDQGNADVAAKTIRQGAVNAKPGRPIRDGALRLGVRPARDGLCDVHRLKTMLLPLSLQSVASGPNAQYWTSRFFRMQSPLVVRIGVLHAKVFMAMKRVKCDKGRRVVRAPATS